MLISVGSFPTDPMLLSGKKDALSSARNLRASPRAIKSRNGRDGSAERSLSRARSRYRIASASITGTARLRIIRGVKNRGGIRLEEGRYTFGGSECKREESAAALRERKVARCRYKASTSHITYNQPGWLAFLSASLSRRFPGSQAALPGLP